MKVKVYFEDWINSYCAYSDDDEPDDEGYMDRGWGSTPEEAIQDLKEIKNIEDSENISQTT